MHGSENRLLVDRSVKHEQKHGTYDFISESSGFQDDPY